ncbi:MAG: class I SAM-dependent methyltransferase [Deltaproteobacteria bacterium]|nr:class I SAM-dependent methyltransferase [Deltaproteobacteria bacterium]MBW2416453.1 class I SAM-dependent methyltransferase [Deltaproteobacteria bacterium]
MRLRDLAARATPDPWSEEEKIPWHEPGFSARMLREHLTQAHDAASRRLTIVDRQVDWVHESLLAGRPSRVLDLACGPGLYASRLARRGHDCVGIDFSPASIAHARGEAARDGLACTYHERDLREGRFGEGFALALFLFGEINAFRAADAQRIVAGARSALAAGGALVIEASTEASLRARGQAAAHWSTAQAGLFSDEPHLVLKECFWHADARALVERYYVVDLASGAVTRYGISSQAYSDDEYASLLLGAGFASVDSRASLEGEPTPGQESLRAWIARA